MRPKVKYQVIYRHQSAYPVSVMCTFFGVSRSGYYDYVKRMNRPEKDVPLAALLRKQQEHCFQTYGYRRMHLWLERQGIHHNPKTVLRLKHNLGRKSIVGASLKQSDSRNRRKQGAKTQPQGLRGNRNVTGFQPDSAASSSLEM